MCGGLLEQCFALNELSIPDLRPVCGGSLVSTVPMQNNLIFNFLPQIWSFQPIFLGNTPGNSTTHGH